MTYDKKDIALTVGGILASITVAYLVYRMEANNASVAAQNQAANDAQLQAEIANQQSYAPSISVPQISSTPSVTDSTNQALAPAPDSNLSAIIAAFQASDQTSVTSVANPSIIPTIAAPVQPIIAAVADPTLLDYSVSSKNSFSSPIVPVTPISQGPGGFVKTLPISNTLLVGSGV